LSLKVKHLIVLRLIFSIKSPGKWRREIRVV